MKQHTLIALGLAIALGGATARAQDDRGFEIAKNLEIFSSVYKQLNYNYVDDVDPGKTIKVAIDAMLSSLDPYTNYYPESQMEDVKLQLLGEYGGIGSLIVQRGDSVYISEPYEGLPAAEAGLMAGDRIVAVDGQSTQGKTTSDVSAAMRGQAGTTVDLRIERNGKLIDRTLTRRAIKLPNVPYFGMVEGNCGYIKLDEFTTDAAKHVREALVELKRTHPDMKGLLLDLRGNGGGVVEGAVQIVGCFVPKGSLVLATRGRAQSSERIYKTTDNPVDTRIPLAVLIDGGSASASEITAGALQDMDRAVIIGARSFGKGLVQSTRPLPYDGLLKVTTAKYYLPSGRPIQEIDYSQRDNEGSLSKTRADSVARTYRTASGRFMPEGKGITPDLEVLPAAATQVLYALVRDQSIFDFATQWAATHPTCLDPDHFQVTDELFDEFKQFVKDGHYKADETNQEALKLFRENVKKEGYLTDSVSAQFDRLAEMLRHDTDRDMDLNRAEISRLLSSEIMDRYYYQRGQYQNGAVTDECLARASEMFAKPGEYKRLLKP